MDLAVCPRRRALCELGMSKAGSMRTQITGTLHLHLVFSKDSAHSGHGEREPGSVRSMYRTQESDLPAGAFELPHG